jgi:uncharacterized protein
MPEDKFALRRSGCHLKFRGIRENPTPTTGSLHGMKIKKPRTAKAVKPVGRTLRRATRKKTPNVPRRKPSPAKVKAVKRKTKAAAKTKTARRRVPRKPGKTRTRLAGASQQTASLAVVAPEQESNAIPLQTANAIADQETELPGEEPTELETGLKIPQVLLEGDEPSVPPMTGPGQKYAVGLPGPASRSGPAEAALPEAYGTGKLLLIARDPYWLYAHWDLTAEQQRHYNSLSADHHLVLRVCTGTDPGQPTRDIHVHPESRHWFVHVERGGTQHVAKLGYYRPRHHWVTIATSLPAKMPAPTVSADQTVRFATIPAHVRLTQLAALAKQAIPADLSQADAARERALAELVTRQLAQQEWASSEQVPELVRGRGEQKVSASEAGLPVAFRVEVESVSSPGVPEQQGPAAFWLNVSAELVIYGGTEPGASVTIGGRPISLRPDGTFSCRYSLPDGEHSVTVSALSAQGELRQAELKFSRHTNYRGEAAPAPQDPSLQAPPVENP